MIVCDGFTGNVALKISEGLVDAVEHLLGEELQSTFSTRMGYLLSLRAFRRFRKRVDYSEYGGAPLLGVNGLCIVGHGRSSAKAVRNAVAMAHRFATFSVIRRLEHGIAAVAVVTPVIAFIFPGQGSQKVGMGRALAEAYPACRAVFERRIARSASRSAASASRAPTSGWRSPRTRSRPSSPSAWPPRGCSSRAGIEPDIVAGHSLGEYSAHVVAGTLGFADAVRIVRRRGRYMQEAVPVGAGAMAALLGADEALVAQACAEAAEGEVVSPANLNAPGQVVIAGTRAAVARAGERAKALGARRVVPLPVSAPFHCALMKPAEQRLAPELRGAARARPAGAGRRQRGRASRRRRQRRRHRGARGAGRRRRCDGRRSSDGLRRPASARMLKWVPERY